jgi:hypothetical protein
MNKAFVVMNQSHQPIKVFLIPELHTTSHYVNQLHAAAEAGGRYGLMLDVQDDGALRAVDAIKKMAPESNPR